MIEEKEKIIKLLSVLFPKAKIYLFGSRARGKHSEISDIDIAIDNEEKLPFKEKMQAINIMEALNIPQKIDLVDFHDVDEDFQKIILKEGILWKD